MDKTDQLWLPRVSRFLLVPSQFDLKSIHSAELQPLIGAVYPANT